MGTHEKIMSYADEDDRIRLLADSMHSSGYAKNYGLDRAVAPYIAIVEPDDYIEPDMLNSLYSHAQEEGADVVKGEIGIFEEGYEDREDILTNMNLRKVDDSYEAPVKDRRIRDNNFFRWSLMEWEGIYSRSFLEQYGIRCFEESSPDNRNISLRFLAEALNENMYMSQGIVYRRRKKRFASVDDRRKIYEMCAEYYYIKKELNKYPDKWRMLKNAFWQSYFQSCLESYVRLTSALRPQLSSRMSDDLNKAMKNKEFDPGLMGEYNKAALEVLLRSPEEFDAFRENEEWEEQLKKAEILIRLDNFKGSLQV